MAYYRLHILLNKDDPQHQVVIEALERLGERGKSHWVRQVLYEAVTGPARSEILNEIQKVREEMNRLVEKGIAVAQPGDEEPEKEPEEAAHNLDGMLDRLENW